MKVLLANPRGFCAGVNMAIACVDRVLELNGSPVYVFHEIVHNRHVVEGFRQRGVVFVDDLEQVPTGSVLVYSAHGVSPAIRHQAARRKLFEIDATCPLVTKVHLEVLRFARDGYTIIFIGHRNHEEAVGTVGEAPSSIVMVETVADIAALDFPADAKLAYVTQTTLSVGDAARIIQAIKQRWPHVAAPRKDDICYATTNRQGVVSALAVEVDLVLVIGSANSSNSRRLVEGAQAAGKPAYLIDDQNQLNPAWFDGCKAVLVTAGASAPEHLVNDLLARLQRDFAGLVEQRTFAREDVAFELPRAVRNLNPQT